MTSETTSGYVTSFLPVTKNFTNFSIAPQTEDIDNAFALLLVRLIVQKVCVPIVVLVGVVGNSLSIAVLTRKSMKSSTNSYLTALAVCDTLYLLFALSLSLNHYKEAKESPVYVHWYPRARVFADMASNVSVILTVTFTLERYIGVCHPMKGRILCTPQRAKVITLVVSTVAILCTLPEFWEWEVTSLTNPDTNATYIAFKPTPLAMSDSYGVGYFWFLVVMFTFLPLILLCVFNGILIQSVIRAARLRRSMMLLSPCNSGNKDKGSNSQPKEQQKITKMLITVVLVFILCQMPGALLLLYMTYLSLANVSETPEMANSRKITANITNLLIQINASINFILYSAISTKFRRVFWRTICLRFMPAGEQGAHWHHHSAFSRGDNSYNSRTDAMQMSSMHEGHKNGSRLKTSTYYSFRGNNSCRLMVSTRTSGSQPVSPKTSPNKSWRLMKNEENGGFPRPRKEEDCGINYDVCFQEPKRRWGFRKFWKKDKGRRNSFSDLELNGPMCDGKKSFCVNNEGVGSLRNGFQGNRFSSQVAL